MTPAFAPPRPVKVVIIGSGVAATAHARGAVAHPGLQLVRIVETERGTSGTGTKPSLADYVEETLKGDRPATFSTLDAALAGLDVDLVAICTPSGTHADIAEQAISAGTHVVIEKPIEVDLVRARRLPSAGSATSNRDQLEYFFAADARPAGSRRCRYAYQALNEVSANHVPGGFDDRELFHGHLRQYEDIIEAIETGREPGVTVTDAVTVLALVRAVYVSQALGLPVAFADVIGGLYDDVVAMTGPSQPGSTQSRTTDTEAAA
jgi:predicted dehydrogenase